MAAANAPPNTYVELYMNQANAAANAEFLAHFNEAGTSTPAEMLATLQNASGDMPKVILYCAGTAANPVIRYAHRVTVYGAVLGNPSPWDGMACGSPLPAM